MEAARQNLPQKQPKAPAPSQPVSIKGGGGAAKAKAPVKVDYDEDEPDDGDSRPSSTAGSKTAVKGKGKPNGGGAAGTAAPAAGKKVMDHVRSDFVSRFNRCDAQGRRRSVPGATTGINRVSVNAHNGHFYIRKIRLRRPKLSV